jgi:hypothetical protein
MSTNDAMKDIERLIEAFEDDCLEDGENREAYRAEECKPPSSRHTSRAALLAAIGKLVSSTQPAKPVGYASAQALRNMRAGIQETATIVPKEEAHEGYSGTHPRDSNNWEANRDFCCAFTPKTALALLDVAEKAQAMEKALSEYGTFPRPVLLALRPLRTSLAALGEQKHD